MAKKQSKGGDSPLMYAVEKESEHWLNEALAVCAASFALTFKDTELRIHVGKIGKAPFALYKDGSKQTTEGYKAFRVDKLTLADGETIGLLTIDHHVTSGKDALMWAFAAAVLISKGFDKGEARKQLMAMGYDYPENLSGSPMPTGVLPKLGARFAEIVDTLRPYPMEGSEVVVRQQNVTARPQGRQYFIAFDKDAKVKLNAGRKQIEAVARILKGLTKDNLAEFKKSFTIGQVGVTPRAEAPEGAPEGTVAAEAVA